MDNSSGRITELEAEVAQLKQAISAHAVVDQAIGVLTAVGRLSPEQAWDVLRETSMRTHTKLRSVAMQLTQWAQMGALDESIRAEIARQMVLRQAEAEMHEHHAVHSCPASKPR
ncbi:ANTAR domain-containing protein [Streptomyces sp. NPDC001661]